jgi:hypothetical protein
VRGNLGTQTNDSHCPVVFKYNHPLCDRHLSCTTYTVMSLSTHSATPGSKAIATTALRSAGLMDRDAVMRDSTDNAGGRKGRIRSTRTARTLDVNMDRPLGSRTVNIIAQSSFTPTGRQCLHTTCLVPVAIPSSFPPRYVVTEAYRSRKLYAASYADIQHTY